MRLPERHERRERYTFFSNVRLKNRVDKVTGGRMRGGKVRGGRVRGGKVRGGG